jgi:hypothetical protein
MNSNVKDLVEQGGTRCLLRENVDYKLDLNLSLADLSSPLFIGGQVSRNWSGLIQISLYKTDCNTTLYFDYDYASTFILGLAFID